MDIKLFTTIKEKIEAPGGDYIILIEVKAKKGNEEVSLGHYDIPWGSGTTEEEFFNKINDIEEECQVKAQRSFQPNKESIQDFFDKYKDQNLHPIAERKRKEREERQVPEKEGE